MQSSTETPPPFRQALAVEEAISDQTATIEFLSKPESYAEVPTIVQRIDTHAAIVFLAGDKAYKLKRSVILPYLDFSTSEKRRQVCERELSLNQQTAPSLYLRVLPIVRKPRGKALMLGGVGLPVDWVIEMRRFDQDALFDRLASSGRLQIADIENLATAIAAFHKDAPAALTARWLQSIDEIVETLDQVFRSDVSRRVGIEMDGYAAALRSEIGKREQLLAERQYGGFVRRCHGDLHLRNIVLIDRQPVLFDALEFDERLATIDVLYDLGFLIMDLWRRDLKGHANALLNTYLLHDASGSALAGLQCMPLFLSLRAAVRAMVGLHGLAHVGLEKQDDILLDIQGYAHLARELLSPPHPQMIAIGGVSGTGKSSLSKRLAPFIGAVPGAVHFRTDVERKRMAGVALSEKLESGHYSASERSCIYRHLCDQAEVALGAGQSVIIDATFLDEADCALVAKSAREQNVKFQGLWLEASPELLVARVTVRCGDASDADADIVRRQLGRACAPKGWIKIDASDDEQQTLQRAISALGLKP